MNSFVWVMGFFSALMTPTAGGGGGAACAKASVMPKTKQKESRILRANITKRRFLLWAEIVTPLHRAGWSFCDKHYLRIRHGLARLT
jgi:hypothetical protein